VIVPLLLTIISIAGVYLYAFRFLKVIKEPLINRDH
jgi:hypothetical protein